MMSLSEAAIIPIETGEQRTNNASVKRDATAAERVAMLETEIAGLKAMAELLRDQLTEVRKNCDAWRSQAERLLLTHGTPTTTEQRPGLLRRFNG